MLNRGQALALIDRRWKLVVVLFWAAFCCLFVLAKYPDIVLFNLSDSDDNMRLMQVRSLLHGQGWYDLRQYRLDPPGGANIHWSRLVDLPIAGLILGLETFLDASHAERLAVAVAPLLPLLLLMFSLALTARRLIDPRAYPLALLSLFFCGTTTGMFMPQRIDHHGWQLAFLALSMAAIADPRRIRGGLTLGVATALSLAIGLEMIVYLAMAGAAVTLFWVADESERTRLRAYAVALGGGTAIAFLLFASYDNRQAVCDALSPVWLSDAIAGAALLYGITSLSRGSRSRRLAVAAVAAVALAVFHAAMWPRCLGRLDGVPPEAQRLWLRYVLEVRPVYEQNWRSAAIIIALPVAGLVGWGMLAWARRKDGELFRRVVGVAAPTLAATLLLWWQSRTGPAAQMLAAVGCAAFIWFTVPLAWRLKPRLVAVAAASMTAVVGCGLAMPVAIGLLPLPAPTEADLAADRANKTCISSWAMRDLDLQPKGVVFTFLDLGPWLIKATHHDAVAGPYHRNSEQIVDTMNAFLGSADQAHALVAKYHSRYILVCPGSWAAQHFTEESPHGFYAELDAGRVPGWLAPIALSEGSPFRMWRVIS